MVMYKIVVLGDGAVGKSALTIQLVQNQFIAEYDPTIENSYRKQMVVDGEAFQLDVLDTAGQEEYAAMRDQYIRTGQGFMLVFSLTARESFDAVPQFHERIVQVKDVENTPIVIAGNKCDLKNERVISESEMKDLAKSFNVQCFETSALARINVDEAFSELVRQVHKWTENPDNKASDDPIAVKKKKGCVLQ